MDNLIELGKNGLNFLIFTVLVKYIITKWLADKTIKSFNFLFVKFFIKTKEEMAIWLHYLNKHVDKNHTHSTIECPDGQCKIVKEL